jgi:hypothetical protein
MAKSSSLPNACQADKDNPSIMTPSSSNNHEEAFESIFTGRLVVKNKKAKKFLKEGKKLIKKIKKQGKDGEMILAEMRKIMGPAKTAAKTKKMVKKKPVKTRAAKTPAIPKEATLTDTPSTPPENTPQP